MRRFIVVFQRSLGQDDARRRNELPKTEIWDFETVWTLSFCSVNGNWEKNGRDYCQSFLGCWRYNFDLLHSSNWMINLSGSIKFIFFESNNANDTENYFIHFELFFYRSRSIQVRKQGEWITPALRCMSRRWRRRKAALKSWYWRLNYIHLSTDLEFVYNLFIASRAVKKQAHPTSLSLSFTLLYLLHATFFSGLGD